MITKKIIHVPYDGSVYSDQNTITIWYFLGIPFWKVRKFTMRQH